MKCERHDDADAVGQCVGCGAGMCADCAEALEVFGKNGMRCAKCVRAAYEKSIEDTKKENKRLIRNNIISIILYIFGMLCIILAVVDWNDDSIILLVGGVIACGIFTGITGWNTMKQVHDEDEAKNGAEYIVDENGIHKNTHWISKLIFFVIFTVIGVVVTPIRVVLNFIIVKNNKVAIKEMYDDIATVESI